MLLLNSHNILTYNSHWIYFHSNISCFLYLKNYTLLFRRTLIQSVILLLNCSIKLLTNALFEKRKFLFLAILHGTNNFIFSFLFINMKNYFQNGNEIYTLRIVKKKIENSSTKWKTFQIENEKFGLFIFIFFVHCFRNSHSLYS